MLVKSLVLLVLTLLGRHVQGSHAGSSHTIESKLEYVFEALSYLEDWGLKVEDILQKLNAYTKPQWSNCSVECGGGYKTRPKLDCPEDDQDNCTEIMYCNTQPCDMDEDRELVATCKIETDPRYLASYKYRGVITMRQRLREPLEVKVEIYNESPKGASDKSTKHGFHVHRYGDISMGCAADDQDYNPDNVTHGLMSSPIRHVGDWGNIDLKEGELTNYTMLDNVATLFGDRSIIGRSIVIHAREDDGGITSHPESTLNGNTGLPVACCVIGLASE